MSPKGFYFSLHYYDDFPVGGGSFTFYCSLCPTFLAFLPNKNWDILQNVQKFDPVFTPKIWSISYKHIHHEINTLKAVWKYGNEMFLSLYSFLKTVYTLLSVMYTLILFTTVHFIWALKNKCICSVCRIRLIRQQGLSITMA